MENMDIFGALERLEEGSGPSSADVQSTFADIRDTLRVPFVGLLFRLLAKDPPLLTSVWSSVRGVIGSRLGEREADRIRSHALTVVPDYELGAEHRAAATLGGLKDSDLATIARMHETVHYALPKLLLVAAAARLAVAGREVGGVRKYSPEDLVPLPRGADPEAVLPDPIPSGTEPAEVTALLERLRDLHELPIVPSYFRALGRWPPYLERTLVDLRTIVRSPRYQGAAATLATAAEVAVGGFPDQVRVSVTGALPREVVLAFLSFFHDRLFPELLLDVAFLRALVGDDRRSRDNRLSLTPRFAR